MSEADYNATTTWGGLTTVKHTGKIIWTQTGKENRKIFGSTCGGSALRKFFFPRPSLGEKKTCRASKKAGKHRKRGVREALIVGLKNF